jgi:hypothetical protein
MVELKTIALFAEGMHTVFITKKNISASPAMGKGFVNIKI